MAVDLLCRHESDCFNNGPFGVQGSCLIALASLLVDGMELVRTQYRSGDGLGRPPLAVDPVEDDTGDHGLVGDIVFAESALTLDDPGEEFELIDLHAAGSCLDFGREIITLLIRGVLPHEIVHLQSLFTCLLGLI